MLTSPGTDNHPAQFTPRSIWGNGARILVVSHSCAEPINQQIYARIQELTGWNFTLLVPAWWKDEFGNCLQSQLWPGFPAELMLAPVFRSGDIILHAYRTRLRRFLRKRKFDLIYVNHEPYGVATAQVCLANRRARQVPFGFYSCQNIEKRYPSPFRWMERWVYRSSAFAFPITEEVGGVLRRKGYSGAMTVAPLPFDPSLYRPRQDAPDKLARETDELWIGYVGRIVEAKGLRTLVQALARLPRWGWKLAVIGSGPFEQQFAALVAESGISQQVKILGFVPHEETSRYLAAFDLLVVPSETQANWREQFGRVIVEALACGTPVIGSDSGEIPKLLKASGGGLIFRERDPVALAEAVALMLSDAGLRQLCAERGRRWAVSNVSLDAVAGRMAETMERAIMGTSSLGKVS